MPRAAGAAVPSEIISSSVISGESQNAPAPRLHAGRVVHRQARANLGRGANLGGQGKLRDVANSDRGAGNNPWVNADVVNGAADLIEHGYDALLKRIGGGELGRIERVGGHIVAPSARAASAASSEVTVAQICGSSR